MSQKKFQTKVPLSKILSQETLKDLVDIACTSHEQHLKDPSRSEGAYEVYTSLTEHARRVLAFGMLAGQATPDSPEIPPVDVRRLRAKLILEEALETIEALGFLPIVPVTKDTYLGQRLVVGEVEFFENGAKPANLKEIIDGCLDLRVVTTGTLLACGVPDTEELQAEVDLNNLMKFRADKDGYRREDGKWVKPSDHPEPSIEGVLEFVCKHLEG